MNRPQRSTRTDIELQDPPAKPQAIRKKSKATIWLLAGMIVLAMLGWLAFLGWGALAFWHWMIHQI